MNYSGGEDRCLLEAKLQRRCRGRKREAQEALGLSRNRSASSAAQAYDPQETGIVAYNQRALPPGRGYF